MKRKLYMALACVSAAVLGAAFIGGLVWSLIPFGGDTLPHLMAGWTGVSFGWSALLVSSLLGLACVGFIAMGGVIYAMTTDSEIEW